MAVLDTLALSIRKRVDAILLEFLAGERSAIAAEHPGAVPLVAEVERLVRAGGKRLRPAFCFLGYRAAGGRDDDAILHVGAGLELFHTFALVHDDVMDRATSRRGAPTTRPHMAEERRRGGGADPEQFGLSSAILAGDLALVLGDHLFLRSGFPPDRLLAALRRYNLMQVEVAVGQFLDVAGEGEAVDETEARRISSLKSGSYTVVGPLHVGAILAGGSPEILDALSRYGMPLGEAFQIADDVRGVLSGGTGLDLVHAKPTVLLAKARELAGEADRTFLQERVGAGPLDDEARERLREILQSSGAIDAAVRLVGELATEAAAALDPAILEPESRVALEGLAALVSSSVG